MASFETLHRWEKFAPDIGDNRQRPDGDRLWLEVKSSMTRVELQAFDRAIKELHVARGVEVEKHLRAMKEARESGSEAPDVPGFESRLMGIIQDGYDAALCPCVRLVGRHTIAGKPVTTLREYIDFVSELSDGYNLLELSAAVRDANSVGGSTELFSGRRSGGWAGTAALSSAED